MPANKPADSTALAELDPLEEPQDDGGEPEPTLPPHVAAFLGEQLQTFYGHLMNEPVPDRFVQILKQLDGKGDDHDGE